MIALLALLAATPIPADSLQMVLSLTSSWDATHGNARLYQRDGPKSPWRPAGAALPASLGRAGLAWGRGLHRAGFPGPVKHEGDGRSPAGVFELRAATGEATTAPDGTRLPYQAASATLRCVDDPGSSHYNRLVDEATVAKDWTSAEDMRRDDGQYRLTIWVGHNDASPTPGDGSCIFLHVRRTPDATTAGCTAFDDAALDGLLRWLDPAKRPVLVQLPQAVLRSVAREWGLPEAR